MRQFFLVPLLFLLLVTGCKKKDKTVPTELLFISNKKYFNAFPDSLERQKFVKKNFKKGFKVETFEIKNFEGIERELESFFKSKNNKECRYILFVEPFLFPMIINSSILSKFDLRVVSYGLGGKPSSSTLGLFHIYVSQEKIFEEIKALLLSDFKRTKKKSVILCDEQNGLSKGFKSWWENNVKEKEQDIVDILTYKQSSVSKDLENAITEIPDRTMFLFAGINNRSINMIKREKIKNKRIIELFTRYGVGNECVSHYIDADYEKMLKSGLKAKELDDFILSTEKNVVNFESEENLLKKKTNKKIRIVRRK